MIVQAHFGNRVNGNVAWAPFFAEIVRELKELFRLHGQSNGMAFFIGSEIYGHLEKVVDRLEDVANEISGIVVENV